MAIDCSIRQPEVDKSIARVAARQWGIVTADDLLQAGLTRQAVSKRVAAGRLFRLYTGVFAVGHYNLPLEGRFLAAVKACGPGAVLSHWSAVVHWKLRRWIEHDIHVTSPTARTRRGIVHHRSERIDRTVHNGIPVTTPARTICDIAATARVKLLRSVVNQALGLELVRLGELITYSGRGAAKLRRVLATAAPTRSENENLVLHLIHEAGLPTPLVNPQLRGTSYIPDFLWPGPRLILEADSRRFHGNLIARADDATRQLVLETMGLRVIRTTWREATTRPSIVQRRVADALAAPVG